MSGPPVMGGFFLAKKYMQELNTIQHEFEARTETSRIIPAFGSAEKTEALKMLGLPSRWLELALTDTKGDGGNELNKALEMKTIEESLKNITPTDWVKIYQVAFGVLILNTSRGLAETIGDVPDIDALMEKINAMQIDDIPDRRRGGIVANAAVATVIASEVLAPSLQEQEASWYEATIIGNGVANIRENPGEGDNIVGTRNVGDSITLVNELIPDGTGKAWYKVKYSDEPGEVVYGYIWSKRVQVLEATVEPVPEAPTEVGTETPVEIATEPSNTTEEEEGAGATETPVPLFKATEAPALKWWDFTCRVVGIDESPHTVGDLTTALSLVCEYQISPTEMAQIPIAIAVNSSDGYMIFGFQPKQGKEVTSYYAQSILEQKIGGSLIGRTMTVSVGLPSASNSGVISVPFVSSAIQSEYTIEGMTDFVSGVSAGNLSSLGTDALLPLYLNIS